VRFDQITVCLFAVACDSALLSGPACFTLARCLNATQQQHRQGYIILGSIKKDKKKYNALITDHFLDWQGCLNQW
jgi:hypothetical protein